MSIFSISMPCQEAYSETDLIKNVFIHFFILSILLKLTNFINKLQIKINKISFSCALKFGLKI